MKKNLLIGLFCIAAVGLTSCDDKTGTTSDPVPNIQFATSSYALDDQPVELKIVSSFAAASDLTVGFTLGGTATADDYDLSATEFTFKAGETEATVTVTPKKLYPDEKTLSLTLQKGDGFDIGRVGTTNVVMKSLMYVYSFSSKAAYVLETLQVTLTINESTFKAPADIEIPFEILESSTATPEQDFTIVDGATKFVVPQGSNTAKITIKVPENLELEESKILMLGLAPEGERFAKGEFPEIKVVIKGPVTAETLAGKWEHVELIGLETLMLWIEEDGTDATGMPSNNDGYYFEIKEVDGEWKFLQGDVIGSLSNLFRTSTIVNTAPLNPVEGTLSGQYLMKDEQYMFASENTYDLTYFKLDPANRSFDSPEGEGNGSTTVAIQLNDDGTLNLFLRDFDEPPFLQDWYYGDDYALIGFGYTFRKVE